MIAVDGFSDGRCDGQCCYYHELLQLTDGGKIAYLGEYERRYPIR